MADLDKKKAEILKNNPRAISRAEMMDAPKFHVNPDVKLPEYVKCRKCGGKPTGYNWLRPISTDPACREFLHLDCIKPGLSREFENQVGGRPAWQG